MAEGVVAEVLTDDPATLRGTALTTEKTLKHKALKESTKRHEDIFINCFVPLCASLVIFVF
jgi:hypothetical protein